MLACTSSNEPTYLPSAIVRSRKRPRTMEGNESMTLRSIQTSSKYLRRHVRTT